jgi:hypothetical protein
MILSSRCFAISSSRNLIETLQVFKPALDKNQTGGGKNNTCYKMYKLFFVLGGMNDWIRRSEPRLQVRYKYII